MAKEEHRSTARVLSILLTLSGEQEGMTLAELAAQLAAPKSSLFPIVHTMADLDFVAYNEITQKYTIGINSYLVGSSYLHNHGIFERIQNEMKMIVDQCSETCQFGVLENDQVLYLAKVDSPEPIRLSSDIGKRLPAYSTSLGKALLSRATREELERLYPHGLTQVTEYTVKDLDALYEQLQQVLKTSIAVEQREMHPDISCIAVPLMKGDEVVASISVSVPAFRFTPEKRRQIEEVLLTAGPKLEKLLEQNSDFR